MTEDSDSIQVWNRRAGEGQAEKVYRAASLRFLFRNPLGRLAMRTVLSTRLFTNFITRRQRSSRSRNEIVPFIENHGIDVSEFTRPVSAFRSFADFFIRELRPETRPVAPGEDELVAPCDGRIQWVFPSIRPDVSFEIKGAAYTLGRLVGDDEIAELFVGGTLLGIYLAPSDYHRFCYPLDGELFKRRRLGRRYYSVNAGSLAAGFRVFDDNIRQSTLLRRGSMTWAMIEVGGFYAGGIVNLDAAEPLKSKGEMKGYFQLGGSFIVLAFGAGAVRVDEDIHETIARGIEVRVQQGERIGEVDICPTQA